MQILLLTDEPLNTNQFKNILNYDKALNQNILLVDYASLYEKQKFIYAKQCMVLSADKVHHDVLLSPSLVIDTRNSPDYTQLETYLNTCWANAQHAFYQKEELTNRTKIDALKSTEHSKCICYVDNNETPFLKIIQESIVLSSALNDLTPFNTMGLIEQTLTEFFADKNYFSQFELSENAEIANHQSIVFSVSFDIIQMYGDYTIENIKFQTLDLKQLLLNNQKFVFNYFNFLLDYRLNRYIEQVKFRTHIIKLCNEYNIELEPSYYKTFVLTKDKHIGLQRTYYGALNSKKGVSIINDKHKTNQFLREHGFNANQSYEYTLDDLLDKERIKKIPLEYPVTLKPTDKKEGYGVVTNIPNARRMLISVKKMLKLEDIKSILLEEFFEGITYRVLVVGGGVVAVLKYIPANIVGDGETAIDDLIRAKNLVSKSRVRINNALRLSIFNDDKTWETILPKDEKYIISHNSHASTGGQSINVTELFDEKYKKVVSDACKSLDLKIAGIDMIVNSEGDYRIIEINCGPALATHVNPKHGSPIHTYTKVLNTLLKEMNIEKEENSYLKELVPYHE